MKFEASKKPEKQVYQFRRSFFPAIHGQLTLSIAFIDLYLFVISFSINMITYSKVISRLGAIPDFVYL
jgi:hypothetical protein